MCLFAVSCKKDSDDDTSANYVGKWYTMKLTTSINGSVEHYTFDECERKSNFNIESSGKLIYQSYEDGCTNHDEYSGNYDDKTKKISIYIDGETITGDVSINNNEMVITSKETFTESGTTYTAISQIYCTKK
ncbi:lipocalin family protein [Soonwooa purpurea]